jgi:hypothetical protein
MHHAPETRCGTQSRSDISPHSPLPYLLFPSTRCQHSPVPFGSRQYGGPPDTRLRKQIDIRGIIIMDMVIRRKYYSAVDCLLLSSAAMSVRCPRGSVRTRTGTEHMASFITTSYVPGKTEQLGTVAAGRPAAIISDSILHRQTDADHRPNGETASTQVAKINRTDGSYLLLRRNHLPSCQFSFRRCHETPKPGGTWHTSSEGHTRRRRSGCL